MLSVGVETRPDFLEIYKRLPEYETIKAFFAKQKEDKYYTENNQSNNYSTINKQASRNLTPQRTPRNLTPQRTPRNMTPNRSRNDLVDDRRERIPMRTPERGIRLLTANRSRTKSPIARIPRFDDFGNAQQDLEEEINQRDTVKGRSYGRSTSASPMNRTPNRRNAPPRAPEFFQDQNYVNVIPPNWTVTFFAKFFSLGV